MTMPHNLIAQYQEKIDGLRLAIEHDDADKIAEIDREVSDLFHSILSTKPESLEDRLALVEFLLDHLIQSGAETSYTSQIKEKVMELAAADLSTSQTTNG